MGTRKKKREKVTRKNDKKKQLKKIIYLIALDILETRSIK